MLGNCRVGVCNPPGRCGENNWIKPIRMAMMPRTKKHTYILVPPTKTRCRIRPNPSYRIPNCPNHCSNCRSPSCPNRFRMSPTNCPNQTRRRNPTSCLSQSRNWMRSPTNCCCCRKNPTRSRKNYYRTNSMTKWSPIPAGCPSRSSR